MTSELIAGLLTASAVAGPGTALAATGSGGLIPEPGQFFPINSVKVLDTHDGTGGVSVGPLASGATATFAVTGVGAVPSAGDVSDVYVIITAISPQDGGCLVDYSATVVNPGICTVSFEPGQNMSDSDIVQVSSSGQVSVTNESSGTTGVSVAVMGYVQANDPQTLDTQVPGDTYVPLVQAQIADTRTGFGAPQAQVPAGGKPDDPSRRGRGRAVGCGGSGAVHRHCERGKRRVFVGLSDRGDAPSEAGSAYQDVAESRIVDTRYGTGGVAATPVPAGGSITFTAIGGHGVPSTGVSSVAESVAAIGPTASGFLSAYPAGGTDPNYPGVNFTNGDQQDNDMSAPVLSAVSPAGRETITNHSTGTVDVVVSARGYYAAPAAPQAPESVSVSLSGTIATVDWNAPPADGGAAITSYTVTASPDNATATVSGGNTEATLSGLANVSADLFTVTATNAVGTSYPTTYAPPNVVTGQVLAPDGVTPVPGDLVTIYPNDPSTSSMPSLIGTATTDSHGNWSFAVPPYTALPADSQAAANANGGWLNVDAVGSGFATANGTRYSVGAVAIRSAWVGTSSQTQNPAGTVALAQPATVMRPDGPAPALTGNQAAAAYLAVNDPTATDSSGNPTGNPDYAYPPVPTDKYGFQESGGDGSYNPNIASDGVTDLTNAPVTPATPNDFCYIKHKANGDAADHGMWTIVGEYHSNWDDMGSFSYTTSASSIIGAEVSADNQDFSFSGWDNMSNGTGLSRGKGNGGTYDSHQVQLHVHYRESYWTMSPGTNCYTWYQWDDAGITRSPEGLYTRLGAGINGDQNKAKTRWRTDGCTALTNLYNAIHTPAGQAAGLSNYWFADQWPETGMGLTHDHGLTYGLAAKLTFAPDPDTSWLTVSVGFKAETTHTVATEQRVEFDASNGMPDWTRNDPWPGHPGQVNTNHYF